MTALAGFSTRLVAWTLRAKFPRSFVTATAILFEQGLADPRGCEYREIELLVSDHGMASRVRTHGWVRSKKGNATQDFAICWHGLVCPVTRVGGPADLEADVVSAVKADEGLRAKYERKYGGPFRRGRHYPEPEGRSVSHKAILPIKACLLFRLGEKKLAYRVWTGYVAGLDEKDASHSPFLKDPYLMLATDWVWALFDRTVWYHMRGADDLALASSRSLVQIQKAVETEADRRGFEHYEYEGEQWPHLRFLGSLPALLRDQERRAREPERQHVLEVGLDKYPDKPERIAALIRDLEDMTVGATIPSSVSACRWSPLVKALINEGEDAVEPLLACLEKDTRLTRAVDYGWRPRHHRRIIGVHEVAHEAVSEIIGTMYFAPDSSSDSLLHRGMAGRTKMAAGIREHLRRFKDVGVEERWYAILADDGASPMHWLVASQQIAETERGKPGRGARLRGEVLRGRKQPSVAELMAKRIEHLAEAGVPRSEKDPAYESCRISIETSLLLAKWDAEASLRVLRAQTKRYREAILADEDPESRRDYFLKSYIADLMLARAKAADPAALDEYAEWVRTLTRRDLAPSANIIVKPMWHYPEHPAVAEAADWLFNDKDSPWAGQGPYLTRELAETPLIGAPGFRGYLLAGLSNKAGAGTVKVRDGTMSGFGTIGGISRVDPLAPKGHVIREVRICDRYARWLSRLDGTPPCKDYWPEAARDSAVAACARVLQQYGDRFRYSPEQDVPGHDRDDKPQMTFPRLDHPATDEDVRRGLAVFSLLGDGNEVRQSRMPPCPIEARWVTLKDYPREVHRHHADGTKEIVTGYWQCGIVWQAEEVLENGKWRRYYGFVGRYCIAKVPAEEIEFQKHRGGPWARLSHGLDCRVVMPALQEIKDSARLLELGKPARAEVWLRNRLGIEQDAPSVFYVNDPENGPVLHSGIGIEMTYRPGKGPPWAESKEKWQELKAKTAARAKMSQAGRTLAPAQEFRAFELDLRDWFHLTRAGCYRLEFTFSEQHSGLAEGRSQPVWFELE